MKNLMSSLSEFTTTRLFSLGNLTGVGESIVTATRNLETALVWLIDAIPSLPNLKFDVLKGNCNTIRHFEMIN